MKNIKVFPALSVPRRYQLKCALLLTAVPLLSAAVLTSLLFFFAQLNLYYLEHAGLMVSDAIREAYHEQVQLELMDATWYIVALFSLTFVASALLMQWAISPFVNAEKVLKQALKDPEAPQAETDWLSESPLFHKVIWGLAMRLRDKKHPFDGFATPTYSFNYRFFFKFVLSFYAISLATGYIFGILLTTVYLKIVSLAISLVRISRSGHYFIAQEELLKTGVTLMTVLSCIVYAIIGYYITRYMSNMLFVFIRAVKEHHFPLKLRDSDVYHSLATAVSETAEVAGLSKSKN